MIKNLDFLKIQSLFKSGVSYLNKKLFLNAKKDFTEILKINPNEKSTLINLAITLINLKKYNEAIDICKKLISLDSSNILAYLNIGVANYFLENFNKSLYYFDQALNVNPNYIDALFNKANTLTELGRYDEALVCYDKVISLDKNYISAIFNKAFILSKLKKFRESITIYDLVLNIKPTFLDALLNKGNAYRELGEFEESFFYYDKCINQEPSFFSAWLNKGNAYFKMKKYEEALLHFDHAIKINPNYYEAIFNKANTLKELNRFDEALKLYDEVLEIKPDFTSALFNKGCVLKEIKKFNESLLCFDNLILKNSGDYQSWFNKGNIYQDLNNYEQSSLCYNKSIQLNPNFFESIYNLGTLELHNFNFAAGWEGYESRWNKKQFLNHPIHLAKKIWQGKKNNNKLLIFGEQGIGDQILYSSILPDFAHFPQEKYLLLDERLKSIFQRSFNEFKFILKKDYEKENLYDEYISIGSLGRLFRKDLNSFQAKKVNYLITDSLKNKEIKKNKIFEKKTCGISWFSSNPSFSSNKSIPIEKFLPILNLKKINYINLQYGNTNGEVSLLKKKYDIDIFSIPNINTFENIDGLLSIIDCCDIIVTISTTVAHLSGAIGKKTLLLLPYSVGKFWYWHSVNGKSLWYPSINIFCQTKEGEWHQPIIQIKEYLENQF